MQKHAGQDKSNQHFAVALMDVEIDIAVMRAMRLGSSMGNRGIVVPETEKRIGALIELIRKEEGHSSLSDPIKP